MKYIQPLLWLIFSISPGASLVAQLPFGQTDNCDDFDPTTFQHTVDRSAPDNWDWRNATATNWTVYMPSQLPKTLPSPFNPPSPTLEKNVVHLQSGTYDYEPDDGWELLFKAFGIPGFGGEIAAPTFILYNRYTSIMRIFIWAEFEQEGFNQAALSVEFSDAHQKGSALLGLVVNPTSSLEGFDVETVSMTPNSWDLCQGCGTWLFADIPTVYDPCTCEQSVNNTGLLGENISEIGVGGRLIKSQTLSLSGTTQAQTPTNMDEEDEESTNFSYKNGLKTVDNAGKFFKSTNALREAIQKVQGTDADDTKEKFSNQQQWTASGWKPAPADQEAKSLSEFKIPDFMKIIPTVGPWISALDALITGGKKNNTANTSQAGAITQSQYSGQLKLEATLKGISFFTPGTEYGTLGNWNTSKEPVYDHILGIFNLMEKPVLEYVTYQPESLYPLNYYIQLANSPTTYFVFPPIKQYKLKPLKYAVNPASELELVDLDIAIQYRLTTNNSVDTTHRISNVNYELGLLGPVAIGTELGSATYNDLSYVERLRQYGVDIAFWPKVNGAKPNDMGKNTYTTGFFPAQCGSMQSVFVATPDASTLNFTSYNSPPVFSLKVRVILRRTDSDATAETEDVIFMATYDVGLQSISGGGTYQVTANPSPQGPTGIHQFVPNYLRDYVVTGFTSSQGNQAFFPLGNSGLPFDLVLDQVNIGSNANQLSSISTEALSSITITNSNISQYPGETILVPTIPPTPPVVLPPGPPVIFRAPYVIEIDPDGSGSSSLGSGVSLEFGLPTRFAGCDTDPMPSPATSSEIQAICTDINQYNPNIQTRQSTEDEIASDDFPLTLFPNPTAGTATLRYELPEKAAVSIEVRDLMGRLVLSATQSQTQAAGQHEQLLDVQHLAAGVYLVVFQTGKQQQTLRLVKE